MERESGAGEAERPRLAEACGRLRAYFEQRNRDGLGPAVAVALTDRDGLLDDFAFGLADAATRRAVTTDTLFQIGSITKSILGTACLRLAESGRIDLDAPVQRYVDWFELGSGDSRSITLHHVLTHTAGMMSMIDTVPSSRYMVWLLRRTQALFAPGEKFHYSNVGYVLLGYVLENVTGMSLEEVLRTQVVEPLGMGDATIAATHERYDQLARGHTRGHADDRPAAATEASLPVPWFEFVSGCASFSCAPRHLAAFLRMLLNRGETSDGRYLSADSFERMISPAHHRAPFDPEYVFGYGLLAGRPVAHGDHLLVKMGGENAGYEAAMIGDVDDGVGVVVFVNSFDVPWPEAEHALRVLQAAKRNEPLPRPPTGDDGAAWSPGDYEGGYESDHGAFQCRADPTQLVMEVGGEALELTRLAEDLFLVPHPDWSRHCLRFVRDASGRVVEAVSGGRWFRGAAYDGPTSFEVPGEWSAYVGHYRAFAPLLSNFRVVARKGRLIVVWAGGYAETVLEDHGSGSFRSEPPSFAFETVRFDCIVDGQAQRCVAGAATYVRVDTP